METPKRVKFPYSNAILAMPNGPDKILEKAKERARTYRLRSSKKNVTRKNTDSHNRVISYVPANTVAREIDRIAPDTAIVGGAGTTAEIPLPNITFTEPIPITPFIEIARRDFPTSTLRTLYGEACEIFAEMHLPCQRCGNKEWIKAKRMQAAFDLTCTNPICKAKYQIKGAKGGHIKSTKGTCEISCGRFPGVYECHKNSSGLDYYLFTYTDTHITNIYYINHTSICANTNLFKRSVKVKTWKEAKNYCMIKIGMDKCIKIL
jgi:hypothetical protein